MQAGTKSKTALRAIFCQAKTQQWKCFETRLGSCWWVEIRPMFWIAQIHKLQQFNGSSVNSEFLPITKEVLYSSNITHNRNPEKMRPNKIPNTKNLHIKGHFVIKWWMVGRFWVKFRSVNSQVILDWYTREKQQLCLKRMKARTTHIKRNCT